MNRGQLTTKVGQKTGMAYDVAGDELTLLQDWANEAVIETLLRTHIYTQIGDLTLASGVSEYRQDTSVLAISDGRGSTPAGIGHYTIISLDEMIQRQSADPVSDSYRKYIAMEGDLIIISPTPSSSTTETLRFYYVPKPTPMGNDGNDPSASTYGGIPTQYHKALEYYMLWQAYEYDDRPEQAVQAKQSQFAAYCDQIQAWKRRSRDRRDPMPRIGYPNRRGWPVPSNSQYPR